MNPVSAAAPHAVAVVWNAVLPRKISPMRTARVLVLVLPATSHTAIAATRNARLLTALSGSAQSPGSTRSQ